MNRSRERMSTFKDDLEIEKKLTYSKLDRDGSLDKRRICIACGA